ncbi:MAG: AbrB/MazE/SpoVT family DNA-binding domain-containing protein [Nanoarchaeota archaeon]
MITRKVMQMSNSSFIVTLPKDWADFNGLIKGDTIDFENSGNDLIIKSKKEKETEVKLDLTDMSYDLVWRHLVCAYRKGANKVVVKYGSKDNLNYAMEFVRDLMGWAIVKKDKDKIIIKDLISVEKTDFEDAFKKVFLLVINMSEDALEGFSKQDESILENVPYSDYNINKFTNLCLRILNLRSDYTRNNSMYRIICTLEEIGDEYRKLAMFHKPGKLSDELIEFFKRINGLLKDYYEMFYNFNNGRLKKFYGDAETLFKDMKKYKKDSLTGIRTFTTLFTIFHMVKSLTEESLVINI